MHSWVQMQKEFGNILLFLPKKYCMELHVPAYLPTCLMSARMLSCWWARWFCWNIFSLKPLIVINFTVKIFPSSSHKMGQPFPVYKGRNGFCGGQGEIYPPSHYSLILVLWSWFLTRIRTQLVGVCGSKHQDYCFYKWMMTWLSMRLLHV